MLSSNNPQSSEKVKIGVCIRRESLKVRIHGAFSLTSPGKNLVSSIHTGSYSLGLSQKGEDSFWGVKLESFQSLKDAEGFIDIAESTGISAEIVTLGKPVTWGGTQLNNEIFTVVFGSYPSGKEAVRKSQSILQPHAKKLGIIEYEDQVFNLDPIRLNPPIGGKLTLQNDLGEIWIFESPLRFQPEENYPRTYFELEDVRIGIDFHWDHNELLPFRGALELYADGGSVTAVNEINLDDYLASLLGSEMRNDWPLQSLSAQAVAARSTVLATRGRHHYGEAFDLCHDDHCQCYQGISRESEIARKALELVPNTILTFEQQVADARYAKTCGGLSDNYNVAWEDWEIPYMTSVKCCAHNGQNKNRSNPETEIWNKESLLKKILKSPPRWAACNPKAFDYPSSAKEMEELYTWSFEISQDEIEEFVERRTGENLGEITDIEVLERGVSGRIKYLRILGTSGTCTVGKELNIRRLLSESHLPSSAFVVDKDSDKGFTITGIGWGHGVGLCQLGAAALASEGWGWRDILNLYYPETNVLGDSS